MKISRRRFLLSSALVGGGKQATQAGPSKQTSQSECGISDWGRTLRYFLH